MDKAVLNATPPPTRHGLIAVAPPPLVVSLLKPEELDALRARAELPPPADRARLHRQDCWRLGCVPAVFIAMFLVAIPFIFIVDVDRMRVSNAVAITMLFAAGFC